MLSLADKVLFADAITTGGGRETAAISLVQGLLVEKALAAFWAPERDLAVAKGEWACAVGFVLFTPEVDESRATDVVDRSLDSGTHALWLRLFLLRSAVSLWPVETYDMYHQYTGYICD